MPVDSRAEGCRQGGTRSVDSLPDIAHIHTSSDFLDQDGGETMLSELLVHTEEVDLGHNSGLSKSSDVHWNSTDETIESLLLASTDANVPLILVARRGQGPSQEIN